MIAKMMVSQRRGADPAVEAVADEREDQRADHQLERAVAAVHRLREFAPLRIGHWTPCRSGLSAGGSGRRSGAACRRRTGACEAIPKLAAPSRSRKFPTGAAQLARGPPRPRLRVRQRSGGTGVGPARRGGPGPSGAASASAGVTRRRPSSAAAGRAVDRAPRPVRRLPPIGGRRPVRDARLAAPASARASARRGAARCRAPGQRRDPDRHQRVAPSV